MMQTFRPILRSVILAAVLLAASFLVCCGEIVEETEETETVEVTRETEQDESDMTAVIDGYLAELTSAYDTVAAANPDGIDEHDLINAAPDAFDGIVAIGADAVEYLCEVGAGYREAFADLRTEPRAYAKCILAYAAAQEIDASVFDRVYEAPGGAHTVHLCAEVLWGMADPFEGILYDAVLCDAAGTELTRTQGASSLVYVDWTEDGRYAILSDRLKDARQMSMATVFDAWQGKAAGLPYSEILTRIKELGGYEHKTFTLRYLDAPDTDVLRIWLGMTLTGGGFVTGYYDYDMTSETVTALEYAPFDPAVGGADVACGLPSHEVGTSLAYLMADTTVYRLEMEVKEDWARTLYINEVPALSGFLFLDDLRVIDNGALAVVTGGTDINSQHLYLFDGTGNLLFETYYLTDKGMIFGGIKAVEDDRILLYGSRGYHGPSLLVRDQEQILSGAYADSLYEDPIPDVMEGGDVTADSFGEVPLYPDRASIDPDLNPELVMQGVYALPYFDDGRFGTIGHVETTQTLRQLLDTLYPVSAFETPENLTVSETVDFYLDQLCASADGFLLEADVIAQNPDAFDALVSLGADAIPYLTDIGDKMPAMHSGTYDALCIRAALARMASYRIDQSLYDFTVLSPDGSICAVAKVGTFLSVDWGGTILTQYDRMVFTDTATGDVLWEYPCEELYMIRLRNQQWSPDGRYFALTFGSEHGADSMVFDVREKTARAFPDIREIAALVGVGEELPSHYHISAKTWRDDGRLDGEVFFDYGMVTIGEGSFVLDPLTGEISDFVCDVYRREEREE